MNAKTTATRATRATRNRAMDPFIAQIYLGGERDSINARYWEELLRLQMLTWMDCTPAERRREVRRLQRKVRGLSAEWHKADRKYQKARELTNA